MLDSSKGKEGVKSRRSLQNFNNQPLQSSDDSFRKDEDKPASIAKISYDIRPTVSLFAV